MPIKSTPRGAVFLSGDDAKRFIEQLDDPPSAAAVAALERGKAMLDSAQWVARGSREGPFMFTKSATQEEALAKLNTACIARRVLVHPCSAIDFIEVFTFSPDETKQGG